MTAKLWIAICPDSECAGCEVDRNMATRNKPKTENTERNREQAFQEGYEAGFQAARKKNRVPEDPLPKAAVEYARKAYRLDGVERVYARVYTDDVMDLWTFVSENDDALRRDIRAIENRMWDAFPFHIFDFGIMGPSTMYTGSVLSRAGFKRIPGEALVAAG